MYVEYYIGRFGKFRDYFYDYCAKVKREEVTKFSYDSWRKLRDFCTRPIPADEQITITLDRPVQLIDVTTQSTSYSIGKATIPITFITIIMQNFTRDTPSFEKKLADTLNKTIIKENDKEMKTPAINFEFGPINDNSVVMSPCGLAVTKGDGSYVAYNVATNKVIDVTGFTFDFGKLIYKMPVAVKDVKVGDLILHNKKPVYVVSTTAGGITAIDYVASEQKVIVPISNMFGFDFVTKVMTLFNFNTGTPDATNPFGNIMPMIFMNSIMNDGNGDFMSGDIGKFMMMSMMMGGQNPFANMFAGPIGGTGSPDGNAAAATPTQFTFPGFGNNT